MAESPSVITDEMRAIIGKESEPTVYEVERSGCRSFARAVGYSDPIFFDEEKARRQGFRSIVAPPGYLGIPVFTPDAAPGKTLGLHIPYERVLNGGTEVEHLDVVCAGDTLTASSKITDIFERSGGAGPMLFVVRESTYMLDGKLVALTRGTVIYY